MKTALEPNEGDRPSKLALARYATGELQGAEREQVAAWLASHPEGESYLAELEGSRAQVAPLDLDQVKRRAAQVLDDAPAVPDAANRPSLGWRLAVPLLVAALAALFLMVRGPGERSPYEPIRLKGDATLVVHQLGEDALLHPYAGQPLGAGDALGFRVHAPGHDRVVVLSVDGTGAVSVFYPDGAQEAEPLAPGDTDVPLPGTVVLDAAPGPEIFVAVFDTSAAQARDELARTFQSGGTEAVLEWARGAANVDAVVVERK